MSNRILHPGNLVEMPGFKAKRDRAGLWTGRQKFHCRERELISLLPRQGAAHPKFGFMTLDAVEFEVIQEGLAVITGDYAGASFGGGAGGEPEDEYFLEISTSEEPVSTHNRYDELDAQDILEAVELATNPPRSENGKKVLEPDTTGWDALKLELYGDIKKGIEAYREPRVTWTKRWISKQKPTGLNDIGKIDTPQGDVPTVSAGRNWMNIGLRSRQRGKVFENEISWELSGRGGWLERYYGD